MEREGRDHEVGTGSGEDGNVVRLQREWFGPKSDEWFGSLEDLVPVGPGAEPEDVAQEAVDATEGTLPASEGSADGAPPVLAEHFWDGVADVHDLIQFPDDGASGDREGLMTGSAVRRRPWIGSPRAAATLAIVCCGLIGLRVLAGGTGPGHSRAGDRGQPVAGLTPGGVDRLDRPSQVHVARDIAAAHPTGGRQQSRMGGRGHSQAGGHSSTPRTRGSGSTATAGAPVQRVTYTASTQSASPTSATDGGSDTGGDTAPDTASDSGSSTTGAASGGGGSSSGAHASRSGPTGPGAPFGPGHMGG